MLFDLRSSGRRRTIKVVYVTLAVLMGGGLVLFGIGGEVSGGFVDALTGSNRGGDATERFEEREQAALAATRTDPQDAAAYGELARARFQLASAGENIDPQTGAFTEAGLQELREATQAWERYVELAEQPDAGLAALMAQAYISLQQPAEAADAQEIIAEERPGPGSYAQLAVYAYAAGQERRGNLARQQALELADQDQRAALRQQLNQAREQGSALLTQPAPQG